MEVITSKELDAYEMPTQNVRLKHISELWNEMIIQYKKDPREVMGFPVAGWPAFNEAFGGARPGEVITLTGETGSGKSSFAENWLFEMLKAKIPALLISLEMSWAYKAKRFAQMIQDKPFEKLVDTDIAGLGMVLKEIPLWIYAQQGMTKDDQVLKCIDYACRQKGCRFIVLDHLDYIEKTGQHWQNDSYIVGDFMRKLCGKVKEVDATVVLVAHPKKLNNRGIESREVGMDELKGSSSIKQESDAVLSIFQPKAESTEAIVRFQKIRAMGVSKNTGGFIRFDFQPDSGKFKERSLHVEWGNP